MVLVGLGDEVEGGREASAAAWTKRQCTHDDGAVHKDDTETTPHVLTSTYQDNISPLSSI